MDEPWQRLGEGRQAGSGFAGFIRSCSAERVSTESTKSHVEAFTSVAERERIGA
jgi:hypothetical protein